ncbi:MAG TPA: cobalamin-dependent protein [Candidatus Methylomirabilis sp.]|jgi:5-methyltetrahydrofolate--homocysteine methyltransferase
MGEFQVGKEPAGWYVRVLAEAVASGDLRGGMLLAEAALAAGVPAQAIVQEGIVPGLERLGARFSCGEAYLPELMVGAKAAMTVLELLRPHLEGLPAARLGTVVLGTVQGDLHDIGKNLVAMLLRGAGFDVVDLGVNVSGERFVAAMEERRARLVGLSALLTTTMQTMPAIVGAIRQSPAGRAARIAVGGAPLDAAFAARIGADGFAKDAAEAVALFRHLHAEAEAAGVRP